jgi:hypothetical protein
LEHEVWAELSAAISQVDVRWRELQRVEHRTAVIVRVHCWAALHDRPTSWACKRENWSTHTRPRCLPDQSTMSRRMRGEFGKQFEAFRNEVAQTLTGRSCQSLLKKMDGKALPVAAHSKDPDARWGRGTGQQSKGYKLHMIRSKNPMPEQWAVTPLDVDERVVARRMIKRLDGAGYLLCDGMYDASDLHDRSAAVNHQLVAPRRKPNTGLGHRRHSRYRIRCLEMLEPPANVNCFGSQLYRQRAAIERDFGNLSSFGGGLSALPAWARRIWRVRAWVHAKLLINAARIKYRKRGSHA